MRERVLALFTAHHLLVEEDALDLILTSSQPLDTSQAFIDSGAADGVIVTPAVVAAFLSRGTSAARAPSEPVASSSALPAEVPRSALPGPMDGGGLMLVLPDPPAGVALPSSGGAMSPARSVAAAAPSLLGSSPASERASFRLVVEGFVPPEEAKAPLEGVTELMRSRFRTLSRLLRGRADLTSLRAAAEVARSAGEVSVIGMVREVAETPRQKLLILTVEDESGQVRVLIPKEHPAARETYLPDEVLGLRLFVPKEPGKLPIARAVLRPDVPVARQPNRSSSPSKVLFLSDLHIGSKGFLTEAWAELMGFVRGEGPLGEKAKDLSYVVIAGDLVDGIGVYPHQERDLEIADVVEQYAELGRRLKELPSRLQVIAVPGNHDAVCPAEPQPALPPELGRHLPENVRILSNPSVFALNGVVVEAYHGRSFDDLIPQIPKMSYERPLPVMKRMLAMRHLAPSYGMKTPLASLPRDGMVVDPVPDIFVTGHTHTFGLERWHGVLLLNASTWLAETDYQRMRNIRPVPGRATVVDLQDGAATAVDFLRERPDLSTEVPKKEPS